MTVDQHRPRASEKSPTPGPSAGLLAAGLTFANLLVTFWGLIVVLDWYDRQIDPLYDYLLPQEIWAPMLALLFVQATVNGLVLLLWHTTRRVGLGILAGALAVAVGMLAFLVIVVAPAWA